MVLLAPRTSIYFGSTKRETTTEAHDRPFLDKGPPWVVLEPQGAGIIRLYSAGGGEFLPRRIEAVTTDLKEQTLSVPHHGVQ